MGTSLLEARDFILIAFPSTHQALLAESIMMEKEIDALIIPTPAGITSGCGLSLKIWPQDAKKVYHFLREKGVAMDFYRCRREGHASSFETISLEE